jgi:RHS repeat-associated protein
MGYENVFSLNPYTYRGYRNDQEIGLYYLNSRYYNPETGRFLNADGMLGEAGDILSTNMYAYCANNPIMNVDSNGYMATWLKLALVALAVVAAVVVAIAVVGIGVVVATSEIYSIGSNIAEIIRTETFINKNSDVEAMTKEEYTSVIADKKTVGLSEKEKLAFIRFIRESDETIYQNWTEGQMLREFNCHDKVYNLSKNLLGIPDEEFPSQNTKYVDFEKKQTIRTYLFRFFGNMIP